MKSSAEHKTFNMEPKNDSNQAMKLLLDTFAGDSKSQSQHPGAVLLSKVYQVIMHGQLKVNGQLPDKAYPLGEYLMHGGRIRFDLSELEPEQRKKFYEYLYEGSLEAVKIRHYATHRIVGKDTEGIHGEQGRGTGWKILGAMQDTYKWARGKNYHKGVDLPIGGIGNEINGHIVEAKGESGHLYIYQRKEFMMIGIEPAGLGSVTNIITGQKHSMTGAVDKYSPFGLMKSHDPECFNDKKKCPLSTTLNKGQNWASVKVTPEFFRNLMDKKLDITVQSDKDKFLQALQAPHPQSVAVETPAAQEQRFKAMEAFQKGEAPTSKKDNIAEQQQPVVQTHAQDHKHEAESVAMEAAAFASLVMGNKLNLALEPRATPPIAVQQQPDLTQQQSDDSKLHPIPGKS